MEKWQSDMEAVHNKAELIIAKQRHGPTGKIPLFFEGEFTRFADLDVAHGGLSRCWPSRRPRNRSRRDRGQLARARSPAIRPGRSAAW